MNCELLKIAHWSHEADGAWRISLMRQMVHGAVSSGMAHQSQSHQTTPEVQFEGVGFRVEGLELRV